MWYNLTTNLKRNFFVKQKEKEKIFFQNKSARRLALTLFFIVCGFLVFNFLDFNPNKAKAATNCCTAAQISTCENLIKNGIDGQGKTENSKSCNPNAEININGLINKCLDGSHGKTGCNASGQLGKSVCAGGKSNICKEDEDKVKAVSQITADQARSQQETMAKSGTCGVTEIGCWLILAFNSLLYAVFQLMGGLLVIAAKLFDWFVDAKNFNTVITMTSVEEGWRMVRDFLNLFFILVLLFSAFCTIFQVEKYNIKKILLTLVIMALLVNFSFPISRFIIDAGNIPMYYFFQNMSGGTGSISKNIFNNANSNGSGEPTGIMKMVFAADKIEGDSSQTLQLIAAILFLFMFALTLLVIAILFVIRMLVLVILIIFSPVGFVAAIFPSFSKYSSDWWEQLFKQSFFGTVMAFMLYLSLMIMQSSQKAFVGSLAASASTGGMGIFDTVVVGGVTLAVPIVLLWIGIISAQKIGAVGGSIASVKGAKMVGKWGKKIGQGGWRMGAWGARKAMTSKDAEGNVRLRGKLSKLQDTKVGSLLRRSSAKADARKANKDKYKNYQSMLNSMSSADREAEFKSQSGYKQYLAGQAVMKAGQHKKMERVEAAKLHEILSQHGDTDNAKKLADDRWDINMPKLGDTIKKQMANGDHKKNTSIEMIDDKFIDEAINQTDLPTVLKMINEMPSTMQQRARDVVDKKLVNMSDTERNDPGNATAMNFRKVAAASSSDPHKYFSNATVVTDPTTGERKINLGNTVAGGMIPHAKNFFESRSTSQVNDFSAEALEEAVKATRSVAFVSTVASAKVSSEKRSRVKAAAIATRDANLKAEMDDNPMWKNIT